MANKPYHHGDLKKELIRAGIQVLSQDGAQNFSMRKVAVVAGVSHSAPYAHYADKQTLIAAISTAGFGKLYERLRQGIEVSAGGPPDQLRAIMDAYLDFARSDLDLFRITFSASLDTEGNYPAFAESSNQNYSLLVSLVCEWQKAGFLKPGDPEITAVALWGMLHGITILYLDRQIPLSVSGEKSLQEIVFQAFQQLLHNDTWNSKETGA